LVKAVREAIEQAQKEGNLFSGGVTQRVLDKAAESGVFGEAIGEFLGNAIRNVVTEGVKNVVRSWFGTIAQLFGGGGG
jgi:hypothetical protein